MTLRGLKEYAQVEEVSAGLVVDSVSASDLSHRIGVSEMAEYLEKVQRTSMGPYVDLVPGKNGTGTCLTRADTRQQGTCSGVQYFTCFCGIPHFPLTLD